MTAHGDRFAGIDQNIAANLRIYREAGGVSQEELAQRMTDRGLGFSQATIWKIESGQRPVKVNELVALADSLQILAPMSLTRAPDTTRHQAQMQWANRRAYVAYHALKDAAGAYIEAQYEVLVAARDAHDHSVTVTELYTSFLGIPAEQAVIEARIEGDQEDAQSEHIHGEVGKVLAALRTAGYEASLRVEDLQVGGGGPLRVWAPGIPGAQEEEDPGRQA
jgi:transcriptional regulator with XRE-family HTH domain